VTIGERKYINTWGVAVAPKKKYLVTMNNFKNLLIAILTGLLALSLFTQPAQSAPTSQAAKIAQYTVCLNISAASAIQLPIMETAISQCKKYQP
jgi:hypothetical protein